MGGARSKGILPLLTGVKVNGLEFVFVLRKPSEISYRVFKLAYQIIINSLSNKCLDGNPFNSSNILLKIKHVNQALPGKVSGKPKCRIICDLYKVVPVHPVDDEHGYHSNPSYC